MASKHHRQVKVNIRVYVKETAVLKHLKEITIAKSSSSSKSTMVANSGSFASAVRRAGSHEESTGGSGGLNVAAMGVEMGASGSGSKAIKSSVDVSSSIQKAWEKIIRVSESESEEYSFGSTEEITFQEGTTQLWACQETTVTIGHASATLFEQRELGVGLVKDLSETWSPEKRLEWETEAWKSMVGAGPAYTEVNYTYSYMPPATLLPVQDTTTLPGPDGNQKATISLDQHKVLAPEGVLTGFGLQWQKEQNTMNYKFSYLEVATHPVMNSDNAIVHQTPWNDDDADHGWRNIYLDRHLIMAPKGHFLAGFRLVRGTPKKYCYLYWTRKVDAAGPDKEGYTRPNDNGNGAVIYLNRHNIQVPKGCGLRGFQLHRPTVDNICYKYWYAALH